MIDIHNHMLYGIDDGSKTLFESIDVIKDLESLGFTDIILTPHYLKDTKYSSNSKNNYKLMQELQSKLNENNIKVKLYLGNEIFYDEEIFDLLVKREIYSLNGTNYILVELPMSGEVEGYLDVFSDLIDKGCKIILAHPERYGTFQKDYNKIIELEKLGVLFQCNMGSILGKYGESSKKLIKKLLKDKKIAFLSTDIHHKKHNLSDFEKAKKHILKYINEYEFNILVNVNPSYLIN